MRLGDRALGALTLIGGVLLMLASMKFSPLPGQKYGAETLPEVVAMLAIVVGLCLLIQGLRQESGAFVDIREWAHDRTTWLKLIGTVVLMTVYILVLERLGFTIASLALVAAMLLLTGTRAVLALPIALVTVLVVQFAFGRMLLVPLPRGDFLSLPW